MTSPFLELRQEQRLGEAGAALLYAVAEEAVRSVGVPPPSGRTWRDDDLRGVAHDFLADEATEKRMTALYLRAHDDESMRKMLFAYVRNWLRSAGRATEAGRLVDRVRDAAAGSDDFEEVDTPAGRAVARRDRASDEPWAGSVGDLVRAAYEPEVRVLRYRSDRRRDPEADNESFRRVLDAVLREAAAPVLMRDLRDVFAHRFALFGDPIEVELDVEPGTGDPPAEDAWVADQTAADIWSELTDSERQTLAVYGPVRDMAAAVGKGKSQTAVARKRLEDVLTALVGDDPDADRVVGVLRDRAVQWARDRTETRDDSSEEK